MSLMDRKLLKNLFKKGSFPKQANFEALIDSSVNIVEDGLDKDEKDGLKLYPLGGSKKLLSFYESIQKKMPAWHIALNPDNLSRGLSLSEGSEGPSRLFLREGGNVGINTTTPRHTLEVDGIIGMKGRLGIYGSGLGQVDANGKWQNILEELEGNHAYEIMAYVELVSEDEKTGETARLRRALLHATVVSTYGRGPWWWKSINRTQSFRKFRHRMRIRWKRSETDSKRFNLQLKTVANYGKKNDKQIQIIYRITQLWDIRDEAALRTE